jgi:hypothetical protein
MEGESVAAIAALHKIDSRCPFVAGGRALTQQNSAPCAAGFVAGLVKRSPHACIASIDELFGV